MARTLLGVVGISSIGSELVILNVSEGSVHHTTVATTVEERTVDQFLFGEIDGVVSLTSQDKSRFERTSGGESPTGTTLTLVLDSGDLTSGNPVDGDVVGLRFNSFDFLFFNIQSKISALEFFSREIGEFGKTQSTGGIVLDDFEVVGEDFHSVDFHIGVRESLTESLLVKLPLLDNVFVKGDLRKAVVLGGQEESGSTQENGTS